MNITGSSDLGLFEVNEAAEIVSTPQTPMPRDIGAVIDDSLGDTIKVTVIATGFEAARQAAQLGAYGPTIAGGPRVQPGRPGTVPLRPAPTVKIKPLAGNDDDIDIPPFLRNMK